MKARSQPSFARALRALRASLRHPAPAAQRPAARVFVAYSDVASAREALAHATAVLRTQQRRCDVHPMLWRFNQLDDARWQDVALRDAAQAELLVLAMPDADAFCARTEAWLDALLLRTRGASLTVLLMVGDNEPCTITLAQPRRTSAGASENHSTHLPEMPTVSVASPRDSAPASRTIPPSDPAPVSLSSSGEPSAPEPLEVFASPVPGKIAACAA